ncbi:MAG: uracil-DNA glycosylase family protein [Flavobacteriales bacterium]
MTIRKHKPLPYSKEILRFLQDLHVDAKLPAGVRVMNPYTNPQIFRLVRAFYEKFYHDRFKRIMILGINPGRLGAGETGIPFTDNKHLQSHCGIEWPDKPTHETSSVFMYDMMDAFGGVDLFYKQFYITSVSPLGFTVRKNSKEVNYNYYDSNELQAIIEPLATQWLMQQLKFGIRRDVAFVLGTGKNAKFMCALNERLRLFDRIITLEHPRYIMQYKLKSKDEYVNKFVQALSAEVTE